VVVLAFIHFWFFSSLLERRKELSHSPTQIEGFQGMSDSRGKKSLLIAVLIVTLALALLPRSPVAAARAEP
jgi:hypothetical protein